LNSPRFGKQEDQPFKTFIQMLKVFSSLMLLLLAFVVSGQTIENVAATFADGKVIVTYDIKANNPKQQYKIDLYSSHNGYSYALKNVTGDAGSNITSGTKRIVWDATTELETYSGQVTFKVKGEILPLAFSFITPSSTGSMRRGKSNLIKWEGGAPGQNVKLELYEGDTRVTDIADTKNTGQYTWAVPKDFKTGKNYTLRIANGTQTVNSTAFAVKPKVPLLLKVSPLLIIGAVIIFWPDSPPPPEDKLAGAPNPS
jgi:Ser-Thr-rich glycosyl-phosphatidyl-inositol-anchored membrane family